ncbi:DUF4272 domain-containing protein [Paenibacillus motobuensis]|uniref:DUF4272 domain-containing protein n=1 Tax=Paenibacillus TaxID=44249 RepID=UPI00203B5647|nr:MULTISPECIES: DUF4272 domain-containing protein [Paenibacillus]MCM3039440.1 DUF4272 domain-containing protein [Paenibacillus lutimineralis]MCM3646544.1 DUF4272 domain-containing protein [Paenibacillus motobuensis]
MKYFSIFASKNDIDDLESMIASVFARSYKIGRSGSDYILQSNSLFKKQKLTIRVLTEDASPDYFEANIPGMMGFYDRIPFADEHLKELVLTQISVFNTLLAIEAEKELNEGQWQLCLELMSELGGIGFLQDGTLLDSDGQAIVHPDGSSGPADFRPHACTNKIMGPQKTSEEGAGRKQASISYIRDRGIPYLESMPELPSAAECNWKTPEEIARRATALLIVIQYACDVAQGEELGESKDFIINLLQKFGVEEQLTNKERELLQDENPTNQAAINITWQYEAYWALIWALGLVEKLDFPDQVCDCDYAIKVVSECDSFDDFYRKTSMRSQEEILDEADRIYRLHWACVDSRIHGQEAPAGMNESIVMERRRGLFWMIGRFGEGWDDISMDT